MMMSVFQLFIITVLVGTSLYCFKDLLQ